MNRRSYTARHWLEILTSAALMGLSAFAGMLALEYLVTGTFSAARQYSVVALMITLFLGTLQWRRYRSRPQGLRNHSHHPQPRL